MGLPPKTSQTYQGKEALMLGVCWCCLIHANANNQDRSKGHKLSLNKLRYRGFEIKNNETYHFQISSNKLIKLEKVGEV